MSWLNFHDKVVVITGAGSGMGAETARQFGALGAKLVLLGLNRDDLEKVAHGYDALPLACDISQQDAVLKVRDAALSHFKRFDVLVNCAGILRAGHLESITLADWQASLNINLNGYFIASQAFGANMCERGQGALVHVASIAGTHPQGFSGSYSASKAAILALSKQLAFEWGAKGVRSNAISPGMIRTPMSESFYAAKGVTEAREKVIPLRRIGTALDIAEAALFLASEKASYITGQNIEVDGGYTTTLMSHAPRPGF